MAIQQMFLGIASATSAEPDGSVYFDGIDDRLTFAATSDFAFDTNDFTIEAFVNRVADDKLYSRILHFGPYWNNDDAIGLNFDDADHATKVTFGNYKNRSQGTVPSNARVLISNSSVSSVGWYHIAVTRHNGIFRLFINGILEDTNSSITGNDLETSSTNTLAIAGTVDLMGQEPFNANISNVRVIKGTALYTDSFVPPSEALTNVTNTKLLCCQSDTDAADKAVGGTINIDGALPSSKNPFPFTTSYAVDFDGIGDKLSIADHVDLQIGSSTYTMEFWVYKNANTDTEYDVWAAKGSNSNGTREFAIESFTDQRLEWWYSTGGGGWAYFEVADNIPTATWTHICAQKDSNGYFSFFVNGTRTYYSTTGAQTLNTGPDSFCIGGYHDSSTQLESNVKISDFRFIKGQALYTSNFTPPTEELTTTSQGATASNVKLLCCNKITRTDSTVTPGSITSVGDPKSANGPFPILYNYSVDFGGVNGSGDYLSIPDSTAWDIGTNYTAECFFNIDALTGAGWDAIFGQWPNNNNDSANTWTLEYVGTDLRFYYNDASTTVQWLSLGTVSLTEWHHFAFSKDGSSTRLFVDGILKHTFTISLNAGNGSFNIGGNVASGGWINGKVSNVRVTKDQALYTSAFTPSTEPLTTTSQGATGSNVKLLCCNSFNTVTGSITTPGTITANGDASVALGLF